MWMNCYDSDKCNIHVAMPALTEFMEGCFVLFLRSERETFLFVKCRVRFPKRKKVTIHYLES